MALRLEVYRKRAQDFVRRQPLMVRYGTPCAVVVAAMADGHQSCALITKATGQLAGIVTEGDVTRRIAYRADGLAPVESVMSAPVHAIDGDDFVFRAIALMRRHKIRHMPVLDRNGRPLGVMERFDAMALLSGQLLQQIDTLTTDNSLGGLQQVKAGQIQLAEELFGAGVAASEIQQLITDINRDLYERVVESALENMAHEGWGAAPVGFDVLIMGSGGRGESFFNPDQDNGFILDDYPDEDHTRVDGFFIELAERLVRTLDTIGFPSCRGNVMATNPVWRKTIGQWLEQTTGWTRRRNFLAARFLGLFMDFRAACGERRLTVRLRAHVSERVGRNRGFLRELARNETENRTALGWFNRLQVEDDPINRGKINLKLNGTLPLVDAVRLFALHAGIPETATLARIAGLADRGVIGRDFREYLEHAFEHITRLLLRWQIEDFRAGRPITPYIHPDRLSKRDHEFLIAALATIESLRGKLRSEFTADVY